MEYSECPRVVGVGETTLSALVVVLDFPYLCYNLM